MHPTVRPIVPADIAAVTRIYAHAVETGTATFELVAPDEDEMARRMAALTGNEFPCLVAELDGAVAGYAYAGPYRARPAYDWTVEDSVYIAPQAQRRGVGRALMEMLVAECELRGFRQLVAVIGDSQNTGSIALHRACGFADVGVLRDVGFKFGRWLDSVVMQKTLGDGAATPP